MADTRICSSQTLAMAFCGVGFPRGKNITHTHTHTHAQTHVYVYVYVYVYAYVYIYIYFYIQTYTYTFLYTDARTCIYDVICIYICIYLSVCEMMAGMGSLPAFHSLTTLPSPPGMMWARVKERMDTIGSSFSTAPPSPDNSTSTAASLGLAFWDVLGGWEHDLFEQKHGLCFQFVLSISVFYLPLSWGHGPRRLILVRKVENTYRFSLLSGTLGSIPL